MTARRWICRWLTLTLAVVGTVMALTPMAYAHSEPKILAATLAGHERPNPPVLSGSDTLAEPNPTAEAVTYNPLLAPVGAGILAAVMPSGWDRSRTVATLSVAGLQPNRGYAVHAHNNACGATGEEAGPHYQNRIDPAATPQAPSTNPEYANPRNEIWLDVRTNADGSGSSRTTVPFSFTDRAPGSIVVHEAMTTATHPGHAGQAGARLACLTLSRQ
ncbi:MAG: superoxide dismutase [Pseudonocardiaceae bacterium]